MNPLTPVVVWASLPATPALFPGGADARWVGLATMAQPAYTYSCFQPSPGFAPTAMEMNWILNQRDAWIAGLTAWTQCADGQNWGPLALLTTTAGGGLPSSGVSWCAPYGCWLSGKNVGGTNWQTYQSFDGVNWTTFGPSPASNVGPTSYVTDPAGDLMALLAAGGAVQLYTAIYNAGTNTWNAVAGPVGATAVGTGAFWFKTGFVLHNTRGAVSTALVSFSSNLGTTWTNTASVLPVGFGENATYLPLLTAVGTATCLLFAPNATDADYLLSNDGQTWTSQALPQIGSTVVGAGCDQTNGVFYHMISTGGVAALFSSTSGAVGTWSEVRTFTVSVQGFAANGGELTTMFKVNGVWRMMLSTDGGVTWGFARMNASAAGGTVVAAGNGFIYYDATNYALSHQAGKPSPYPF
jgi:hypothetical protein